MSPGFAIQTATEHEMELALPFGPRRITFDAPFQPDNIAIARRAPQPPPGDWAALTLHALDTPVGAGLLSKMRMAGETLAIVVDASLPAHKILPSIFAKLEDAGARDESIVVVAAFGNEPRTPSALRELLGADTLARCKCVWHDPFSPETDFHGFSTLGTPIAINSLAARAGFRLGIGIVQPHASRGYSGGDDIILPGAAAFESAARSMSLAFSYNSTYGRMQDNPCRLDLENVGTTVGLDYVINYVARIDGQPAAAFAGNPIKVHRAAVSFGDRAIWGAELGGPADAAIASPGNDWAGGAPFDPRSIDYVASGVKMQGSIVYLAEKGPLPQPEEEWERELNARPIAELAAAFEKRNWPHDTHQIAAKLEAVVRAWIARRPFFYRHVILVGSDLPELTLELLNAEQVDSMNEAMHRLHELYGANAGVALVPEAQTTLCLAEFH